MFFESLNILYTTLWYIESFSINICIFSKISNFTENWIHFQFNIIYSVFSLNVGKQCETPLNCINISFTETFIYLHWENILWTEAKASSSEVSLEGKLLSVDRHSRAKCVHVSVSVLYVNSSAHHCCHEAVVWRPRAVI